PLANSILWISCAGVVLYFRNSEHMEAAYGLAITVTMLMTTLLLYHYLRIHKVSRFLSTLMFVFFGSIELMFFLSSVTKFFHGGFVTAIIALVIMGIMFVWHRAYTIEQQVVKEVSVKDYLDR